MHNPTPRWQEQCAYTHPHPRTGLVATCRIATCLIAVLRCLSRYYVLGDGPTPLPMPSAWNLQCYAAGCLAALLLTPYTVLAGVLATPLWAIFSHLAVRALRRTQ